MDRFVLYIGNRNYSSWSLRPWMAFEGCGIPFEEVLLPFDFENGNPHLLEVSPTGRVPVLHHGDMHVWESLAIIEYAAELFPEAGLWPAARHAKAIARSVSMEMLSGFVALRSACPMNIRRPKRAIALPAGVAANVARIETIWRECRATSGGPFLFGAFSAADAMFAPVVSRFDTYDLVRSADTLDYMNTIKAHPAFVKWRDLACAEPWIVRQDEV